MQDFNYYHEMPKMNRKILIIDDHPIFRHAMTTILRRRFEETVISEAGSLAAAHELLKDDSDYDLVMLDLNMPDSNGLSRLLDLRNNYPTSPVVIISAETEKQSILQSISYGAVGFISKASSIEEIASSIESIFEGNVCLPSDILRNNNVRSQKSESKISPEKIRSLTRKELTVLKHLNQGLANKVIAYELHISETTVKSHVSSILRKLGASSRVQVVAGAGNIDLDKFSFSV